MNLVQVINQHLVNIYHSHLDPGCELAAGGELVVGSSEDFLPSQFPCIVPTGPLIVPDASLWGVIAVRFYQPQLTHTHTLDTKAGSASQTIARVSI